MYNIQDKNIPIYVINIDRFYDIMVKECDKMIKLEAVTKKYKNGVNALNGMNLSIAPGEFVYVIGPTGAGKSTFMKLLYREEKASSGKVIVNGTDVSTIKNRHVPYFRRRIGIVFQEYRLLPNKTVFENVAFALEVIDKPRAVIRKRTTEILNLVGLEEKARQYPHNLSGGEQQRVAIARAIVNNPKVLIADEPTGNLDPDTSAGIIELLQEINDKQGTTIIVVTHDKNIVETYKKRTIHIEEGCVKYDTSAGGYTYERD